MLEPDRAGGLQVFPERGEVEPVEVLGELEVDVQLLAALEGRVDRLHQLAVLVARDLAGGAKAEHAVGQFGYPFDHAPSVSATVILWAMTVARTLRLGDTEITRIGLGTNRLRKTPENVELIGQAVAAGIGMVDTAHTYTDGQSEATIGEALSPRPDGMVVATKGGYHPGTGNPEALSAQIEESLRRLRTETIDLYYLHRVDPETPLEESLGAIAAYRDRGQIRQVGLSEVGIERARARAPGRADRGRPEPLQPRRAQA